MTFCVVIFLRAIYLLVKMQIYCLGCKKSQSVSSVKYEKTASGRYRAVGKCPKCSRNIGVFVSDDSVPKSRK